MKVGAVRVAMMLAAGLVAAGFASGVKADVVQFTSASFSGTGSFTPAIPQFDSSLGTLTGVQIDLTLGITPSSQVFNIGGSPESFTDSFTNTTGVNPPGYPSGTESPVTWTAFAQSASTDYSYEVVGGGVAAPGVNSFAGPVVSATSTTIVPSGSFAAFLGSGTTGVPYQVTGDVNSGGTPGIGGSDLFFGGGRSFSGTALVTYTYDSAGNGRTPEPASLGLLGIGVAGMLARRRGR